MTEKGSESIDSDPFDSDPKRGAATPSSQYFRSKYSDPSSATGSDSSMIQIGLAIMIPLASRS